jgi:hypothetical protein
LSDRRIERYQSHEYDLQVLLQVWILLGISAAVALGWLAVACGNGTDGARGYGRLHAGVLVAHRFLCHRHAQQDGDRWTQAQGPGLNGNDYMLVAEYGIPPYPLKWITKHSSGKTMCTARL